MMLFIRPLQRRFQMKNKRHYHIIIGSKAFFDNQLSIHIHGQKYRSFLEWIRVNDTAASNGKPIEEKANLLVIKNENYHMITEAAHDGLGAIIEEITTETSDIFIHNPPRTLTKLLNDQHYRNLIDLDNIKEEYKMYKDPKSFINQIQAISNHIFGQENAIKEISKSLWYLINVNRKKPYVIMLYGNSGLGKTELVRSIANQFFQNCHLEKHLSMFKNDNYSDYFFGNAPNRLSLGYELLERQSNLIFFDELDKCPEYFYSTFYTLFDNVEFKDATYDVEISEVVIILTSNFHTQKEMQEHLGFPIYYRIDKFIKFDDFNYQTIHSITMEEIESRKQEYDSYFTSNQIYAAVSPNILTTNENARTIKFKVQQTIETLLFQKMKEQLYESHKEG